MKRTSVTVIALCATLLCAGAAQAMVGGATAAPNPTLVCQQSKLAAQAALPLCLALNSANILKGAPDKSATCQQRLTNALAIIDRAAAKAGTACRYVDNGDSTVSDLNTGLMWEQTTGTVGGTNTGAPNDVNNTYTWCTAGNPYCDTPNNLPDGTAFTLFLATLNNGASTDGGASTNITGCFAGHCDWRLPSIVELQSIIDPSGPGCATQSGPGPCIDQTIFGPTQPFGYWSATTYADYPTNAWGVFFYFGRVGTNDKNAIYNYHGGLYVRAVRSGL